MLFGGGLGGAGLGALQWIPTPISDPTSITRAAQICAHKIATADLSSPIKLAGV